jgi:hypothetical protein
MVASIEYIEGVIATYQRATKANLTCAVREGNVIVLTPEVGDDVMITADLHGNRRNFNAIKRIADLEHHPRRHLILQEVCHGGPTYPTNNGDMSHGMLEDVAKLKATYTDRVHFILSNHELAELTDYPILKAKRMLNLMFRLGLQEMYGPATEKVREAYVEFLRSCPLGVRLPGNVFVCHSLPEQVELRGFDAGVLKRPLEALDLKENGDVFRMVWGRDYRPENAKAFAKKVNATTLIHGHEPCPAGFGVPNDTQIILDCCGENATYLMVPLNRTFEHDELVGRITKLA